MLPHKEKNRITFNDYNSYEVVSGSCNHSFPEHIHQYLCFGKITGGNVLFICNNREVILRKGDRYIIEPNNPHSFASIKQSIYSYLTVCLKNETFNTTSFKGYIDKAVAYIKNADLSALNVDSVCDFVNMSKFHFIREFKKEVGVTPYQFILNQKIRKIRQGIITKHPLSDLALDCGFSDQSHLCNTFKKYMGVSPLQFATNYNNAGENFANI